MYPDCPIPEAITRILERRSVKAMDLSEPGPSQPEIEALIAAAVRVPDHGKLAPWRFITIQGDARHHLGTLLSSRWQALHPEAIQAQLNFEAARFKGARVVIAVISRLKPDHKIPVWEQTLSAGAACQNLILTANLQGYAAQWLTEWYSYDEGVASAMALQPDERFAGFIYIGSSDEKPAERDRVSGTDVLTQWPEHAP